MFTLNEDKSIYATRGDIVFFSVTAEDEGTPHLFKAGDVVRIKIYGKKNAEDVVLQKDFPVIEDTESVEIFLTEEDTKIGEVISKPKDYWYEVELNPFDNPQTIIGYDEDGAKVFKLFPEGADIPEFVPEPEDVAVMDDELDMASTRPVQNQAIARAVASLSGEFEKSKKAITEQTEKLSGYVASLTQLVSEISDKQVQIDALINLKNKSAAGLIYPLAAANVPKGFLLCDGAAYSRTEYPELFAAIGTTYGAGDGETTFNVPNLSTRVPVGSGGQYALGATGGEVEHTLTVDEIPAHYHSTHGFLKGEYQSWEQVTITDNHILHPAPGDSYTSASEDYPITVGMNTAINGVAESAGGNQPHNNMQPYTVVNYIISTGKEMEFVVAG